MLALVTLALAGFFTWTTVRYALDELAPSVFNSTRAVHPVVAAALPVVVAYPDWVFGLAAAGLSGVLVAAVDRLRPPMTVVPRRAPQNYALPELP